MDLKGLARFTCGTKMRTNFIVLVVCLSITMYNFFLVEFCMSNYKGDTYKYATVESISQLIGCMLSGFMLARVSDRTSSRKGKVSKLRLSLVVIYSLMALGAILLCFIDDDDKEYER